MNEIFAHLKETGRIRELSVRIECVSIILFLELKCILQRER